MFIAYDLKNGVEYGKAITSTRDGKQVNKTYINLGRVIDKDKHIFKNRAHGIFVFNPEDGSFSTPDSSVILPAVKRPPVKEKLILDFGDSYFLNQFIQNDGIKPAIDAAGCSNLDTLYTMVHYYILCRQANCPAEDWWEGNYASILYPKAELESQRISDLLAEIGDEENLRRFFKVYVKYVSKSAGDFSHILIDSTELPNSVHFPLTAISNHNGDINNEMRLICVTQQETGLPIYFRYVAGNIVDVSTLVTTIAELKECGINTKFAIMDAGYYGEDNIRTLYEHKVSFISRLKENFRLYKDLTAKYLPSIEKEANLVEYNGRYAYIKRVQCKLVDDHAGYAYLCLDIERKGFETQKLFKRAKVQKLDKDEVFQKMSKEGAFVLVSSKRIAIDKILPTYYTRQQIEQLFDIGKNYADTLPIRVQTEETLRGHLLLTFIASVIVKRIQDKLKTTSNNPISMFMNLRNQKCKVYDDQVIAQEASKKANDCYKCFNIKYDVEIPRKCG